MRILLVAPNASYRITPFMRAAEALGAQTVLLAGSSAAQLPSVKAGIVYDPNNPNEAIERVAGLEFDAVCATDDSTTVLAAQIARERGLVGNSVESIEIARDKFQGRQQLAQSELNCPGFRLVHGHEELLNEQVPQHYPVVLKPTTLSASRGVIRVDDSAQYRAALRRIIRLLDEEFRQPDYQVLVEDYIPGREVAVEGLLFNGRLELLAIFDKPDPLEGPFFEETYYITPSRLKKGEQDSLVELTEKVCAVYGLRQGPVHAEFRLNEKGAWLLELAARTIGGYCGNMIGFVTGCSLEQLVIMHALGERPKRLDTQNAAGVLMVPVPATGVVRRVEGIGEARKVPGIVSVEIYLNSGQKIRAWPEGGSYPGFIFARAPTAAQAEAALRTAHGKIRIVLAPLIA